MNISQGSLVIVGANTPECKVYWNGNEVPDLVGVVVDNDADSKKVVIKVREIPLLSEMADAGIIIRRVLA